ncbi:MAG: efflux RND transporter permease subunit [bacterium]
MFLSSISVKRPVFTTMWVVALVVLGAFGYRRLSVDLMPDVEFPYVVVTSIYPGAGPEEVESQVTKRVEDAVSTLANIDLMESVSREGVSYVILRFKLEADPDVAANDVRGKVDGVLMDLPSGAEKPQVQKFDFGAMPIISVSVSSKSRDVNQIYAEADRTMRDRLSQVPGVATVDIIGGQEREIQVAVDRKKLEHYGVPITLVTAAIAAENVNIPQGRIIESRQEYLVRTVGEFTNVDQIGSVEIPLPEGGFVPLRDVATIRDVYAERRSAARFNGESAVQIDIVKRAKANTIKTADGIYKVIDELRRELPSDYVLDYATDDSTFIRSSVKDVQNNILIGILLTGLLLFLFLRNFRATLIAVIVMPASIVGSFLLIEGSGYTLNMLTLLAIGVSVGVLVTNAIVVLENIIRRLAMGESPEEAAIKGTDEVAIAVLGSVLTNVVVFVPVAFMRGMMGRFFIQFGMTVVYATVFSLLISFTLTPMLAAIFLKRKARAEAAATRGTNPGPAPSVSHEEDAFTAYAGSRWWMDRLMDRWGHGYRRALVWSLARRRHLGILVLSAFACFVGSVYLVMISGGEFMSSMDQGTVSVSLKLPAGTSLALTEQATHEVEQVVKSAPYVVSVLSTVGGSDRGVNEAAVVGKLTNVSKRGVSADEIATELRPRLAGIPGAEISVSGEESEGGSDADLEIEVLGSDFAKIGEIAERLRGIVEATPGLVDVKSSYEPGAEELVFVPNTDELARRGLSTASVALLLRNAFEGDESSVYREAGEEYKIRVQMSDVDRGDVRTLEEMRVAVGGSLVPLTQLGRVERHRGQAEILRRDRQRKITVSANIGEGTVSEKVGAIRGKIGEMELPAGYAIKFAGMYEFQQESFASLYEALILAIVLTFVVLAMLIESFIHPITIMVTLPLGLVGSALGLFFGGQTINIVSMMAMIMLVGIVVNNAILLLDYVGQLRKRGMALREAVLVGCPTRLRAIIMTNLAIAIGMIPQVMGRSEGYEIRYAMGYVTMGGVLVSALFTLILIPALYYFIEARRAKA